MAFDIGINFRATSSYVTDGTNETYSLGEVYPTTRGGVTFGWNVSLGTDIRDRDSSNDRRLAGINFSNTVGRYFQIDLPAAGTYKIYAAAGDAHFGQGSLWDFQDTTTVLASLTQDPITANEYNDATNVIRTEAAWPGSNAALTATFATAVFRLQVRAVPADSRVNAIAHLRIEEVSTPRPRRQRQVLQEPTPEYGW